MEELNFRMVFTPAIEFDINKEVIIRSATAKKAQEDLDIISLYTLFLQDNNMMDDYSNMGYVEEFVDGEWIEAGIEGVHY